jgi:hypothetical protein
MTSIALTIESEHDIAIRNFVSALAASSAAMNDRRASVGSSL